MAISTEESFAPSMRTKASKCAPSSTTAISMGTLISTARACAAASTSCAPSRVSFGLLRVRGGTGISPLLFLPYDGVQNVWRTVALEKSDCVLHRHHGHAGARFERSRRQVRGQNHIRAQQTVADLRLALEYVQRRAGNLPPLERRNQRRFLHHASPRSADEERRRFHHRQLARTNQAARLRQQRHMQTQQIGLPENGIAFRVLGSQFVFDFTGRANRVVINNPHAESARPPRDCPADSAKSQNPECLAPYIGANQLIEVPALPLTRPAERIAFNQAPR